MAELNASKKTIAEFFGKMQGKQFIIPDYQRPYEWSNELCETLWNDIEYFAQNRDKSDYYFLGSVVCFTNDNHLEIIDGQQRITSLLLLLRALYKKLENMQENKKVIILKSDLAPCIWDMNEETDEIIDIHQIRIRSQVATSHDNDTFHQILATGSVDKNSKDNYSQNYLFFQKKSDEFAMKETFSWENLCTIILNKCILLPIECDTQDTALTIFSTLNNRGLPLSDADIFKAQLYKISDNKDDFTENWKELTQICKKANISINDIFRYYMHILRARDGSTEREIGLRKFYMNNKSYNLNRVKLSEIFELAKFWQFIYDNYQGNYQISGKSKQWVDCLWHYPNEYWKYAVSVFFLKYKDNDDFINHFEIMLRKLVAFLVAKFIDKPTVNAIKDDIFKACVNYEKTNHYEYSYNVSDDTQKNISKHASSRLTKSLLLLHAYLNSAQKIQVPTFEIEHIFPKKWDVANYHGWNKKDADEYLDNLGNKIVLEKVVNIKVTNNYFGKKKEEYLYSKFETVKILANYPKDEWLKDDIINREAQIKKDLTLFFKDNLNQK